VTDQQAAARAAIGRSPRADDRVDPEFKEEGRLPWSSKGHRRKMPFFSRTFRRSSARPIGGGDRTQPISAGSTWRSSARAYGSRRQPTAG